VFGHAEFRVRVEILPDGGEFGVVAANGVEGGHGCSEVEDGVILHRGSGAV